MGISYEEAARHIKALGFSGRLASNIVLVREALNRDILVSRSVSGRSLSLILDGKEHWWRGGNNSLNTLLAKRVSQYKSVTNALLKARGLKTSQAMLFDPTDVDVAWLWSQKFSSVVVKPEDGQGGTNVYLDIRDKDEFYQRFEIVASASESGVIVEPFYIGTQVRCLTVNYRVVAATLMRPASVLGNGRFTIRRLIWAKNRRRAKHPSHEHLKVIPELKPFLESQGLSPRYIPKEDERVFLSDVSNLQRGGDSVDITDELTTEQIEFVENVARAIPGMRIAGIDVIFSEDGDAEKTVVLEVNTSPQLSIHHFPWEGESQNVAAHVLDAMFPNSRS